MELLKQFIKCDGEYKALLESRRIMPKNRPKPVFVGGLSAGAVVPFLSSLNDDLEKCPKLILQSDVQLKTSFDDASRILEVLILRLSQEAKND